jgi:hypothetical protein
LRIASLRQEAKNSWPSASSPPQADAPPTSFRVIPTHEPIIPVFHYSNILAAVKRTLEWSKILFSERRGIRATDQKTLSEGTTGFSKSSPNCEKFAYFIEKMFFRTASARWVSQHYQYFTIKSGNRQQRPSICYDSCVLPNIN